MSTLGTKEVNLDVAIFYFKQFLISLNMSTPNKKWIENKIYLSTEKALQ